MRTLSFLLHFCFSFFIDSFVIYFLLSRMICMLSMRLPCSCPAFRTQYVWHATRFVCLQFKTVREWPQSWYLTRMKTPHQHRMTCVLGVDAWKEHTHMLHGLSYRLGVITDQRIAKRHLRSSIGTGTPASSSEFNRYWHTNATKTFNTASASPPSDEGRPLLH